MTTVEGWMVMFGARAVTWTAYSVWAEQNGTGNPVESAGKPIASLTLASTWAR
jgi:hypothetical protein